MLLRAPLIGTGCNTPFFLDFLELTLLCLVASTSAVLWYLYPARFAVVIVIDVVGYCGGSGARQTEGQSNERRYHQPRCLAAVPGTTPSEQNG